MTTHHLRTLRESRGWTQAQLAHASHVSHSTIAHTEIGASVPRYPVRKKLLQALGVEWERHREVFGGCGAIRTRDE